jgi:hypothetical protein
MKKTLIIGGVAAAALFVSGWALAQSAGHGPGGFGPGGMMGMRGQMGRGMHGQMGPSMRGQMGPGMMGMGAGMIGGSATMDERCDLHDLFFRAGPGCLNRFSASISGASAEVRLPSGVAAG